MSRLRRSLAITFVASNGATVVTFLVSLVLARLLTPAEVGIFSMTAVLIGIAHVFRDFGVSAYLLQEKDLTPEKIRSASGILVVTSWLLGGIMFAASGAIAQALAQPATREVMQVLAAGFLFIPFGAITHTLLTREYRAREQTFAYVAGTGAYAISALALAYAGFSYMSLAWANLINIIATGTAYAFFRPRNAPWLPSLSGWNRVSRFSAGAIAAGFISQINNALPDIWLGKANGVHDVGLLSRANGTASIFMQIAGPTVNYAALPHLASLHHRGESLRRVLCKALAYLSVCAWPPLVVTAVYARDVVAFLYGSQWLECAPIVQLLCAGACIGIASHFHGAALQAIGRPMLAIVPSAAQLAARVACILLFFDGTLLSFGWGLVVAGALVIPVNLVLQSRFFNLRLRDLATALAPGMLVTLACGAVTVLLSVITPTHWPAYLRLLVVATLAVPTWVCAVALTRHPIVDELMLLGERYPIVARTIRCLAGKR